MLSVPTPKTIRDRIMADIEARLDSPSPLMPVGLLNILAWVVAGVAFALYSAIAWAARNALPDSEDPEVVAAWAAAYEIPRLDAVVATGSILLTGSNGSVSPAGTIWVSTAGLQYTQSADVTIASGAGTGVVVAADAGAAGNLDAGQSLSLLAPIAGINSTATVDVDGIGGGADQETIAAWDARILEHLRNPPQGGAISDYKLWALDAHPAVTHVWPVSNGYGPGTVVVRFMTYGATSNGIPAPQVVDAVAAYIEEKRPAGMSGVYVVAPEPLPVDLVFSSISPNTEAVKAAVEAEIAALIVAEAVPGSTIPLSHFDEAASLAESEDDHAMAPGTVIPVPGAGQILVPGAITWS